MVFALVHGASGHFDGDARGEGGAVFVADGFHLVHQADDGVVIIGAGSIGIVAGVDAGAQGRVGSVDRNVGGEVVGAAYHGASAGRVGEGRRGVKGFQPVHVYGDAFDVFDGQIVSATDVGHQVDHRAIIAGRGVHLEYRVQQFPAFAQTFSYGIEGNLLWAAENVGQLAAVVAGEGVIETCRALQGFFGTAYIFAGQQGGHDAAASGLGFMEHHFAPAGTGAFVGAGSERGRQGDGGYHLVFGEAQQFAGGDSRAEGAVNRAGSEATGLGGCDEVASDAGLDLIGDGHGRDQIGTRRPAQFGGSQGRRDDAGAGMGEHPV